MYCFICCIEAFIEYKILLDCFSNHLDIVDDIFTFKISPICDDSFRLLNFYMVWTLKVGIDLLPNVDLEALQVAEVYTACIFVTVWFTSIVM